MRVTIVPIMIGTFGRVANGLLKGLEDNCIIENGENTEKSPEDLRRLPVT